MAARSVHRQIDQQIYRSIDSQLAIYKDRSLLERRPPSTMQLRSFVSMFSLATNQCSRKLGSEIFQQYLAPNTHQLNLLSRI